MKKIALGLLLLLMTSTAHAGLIAISTLSNDSQVSFAYFNGAFNTIKNEINGRIESVNIKDATITVDDMASSSSPAQREGDHFNAYTKTGMIPADDVAGSLLTSDISAGTSYVLSDAGLLYRVVTAATSHTYNITLDTWVYIDKNGTFQFVEVAVGGAQPATPSNSLLLARVRTDATEITSVLDQRVTTISLGASEDWYVKGMQLIWSTTAILSVDNGIVRVGSDTVTKTTATTLNIGTDSDFIDGAAAGDVGAGKFLFVYCSPAGAIKFDDAIPDYHDTTGTTQGTKFYYKSGTTYWRNLGVLSLDASSVIKNTNSVVTLRQAEKIVQVVNYQTGAMSTGTTAIPFDNTIPEITEGDRYMALTINPTSSTNKLRIDVVWYGANTNVDGFTVALFEGVGPDAIACGVRYNSAPASLLTPITFTHYMTAGTTSPATFTVRAGGNTGATTTFNGQAGNAYCNGLIKSSITITEYCQ